MLGGSLIITGIARAGTAGPRDSGAPPGVGAWFCFSLWETRMELSAIYMKFYRALVVSSAPDGNAILYDLGYTLK